MRTAESVTPRHPDKICDQVSDAILDDCLAADPFARVAVETMGGHGRLFIAGEVTTREKLTEERIVNALRHVDPNLTKLDITIAISAQSTDIAKGVDVGGAGDQGIMIGYACQGQGNIPQETYLARSIARSLYSEFPFDGKTQVTLGDGKVKTVVCSFQNVAAEVLEERVKKIVGNKVTILANPAGDWQIGGFAADSGLTGRKLMIDNYGPEIPVGGGAFSGKDPTKVDRSAAYMARKIAVDYLQAKSANEVKVKLAYAIGYNQPVMAEAIVDGHKQKVTGYDLSPRGIINFLDLRRPIYLETAKWGHFGNGFKWDMAD